MTDSYREQMTRWAQALATGQRQEFEGALAQGTVELDVKLFLINSFGERFGLLLEGLAFLADAFDSFDALVTTYVREVPRTAYDPELSDEERFVDWLSQTQNLTPLQQDFLTCQKGEYAVAALARKNRVDYLRFQEWHRHSEQRISDLESGKYGLEMHPNPIRTASRLHTSVLAPNVRSLPVEVVFFAVGGTIRTAYLEPPQTDLIRELIEECPCQVGEWMNRDQANSQERIAFVREQARLGLIALV